MYKVIHDSFNNIIFSEAKVETLWTGGRWLEGPVYIPSSKTLLWSDIPNNRILTFSEVDCHTCVFENNIGHQNGHCLDLSGRVIACEHSGRRISRLGHYGHWELLTDSYQGKRLNSPNDVIVKSDGSIWFSDPTYGIDTDYLGKKQNAELNIHGVYRYDPETQSAELVIKSLLQPNGLAFSPDEKTLYVSDSGVTHAKDHPATITAYSVSNSGTSLDDARLFATCDNGVFDGFRVDKQGNIFTSCADGVAVYNVNGILMGKIIIPECVSNLCFGGPLRNRLYITGATSLYAVYVNTSHQ
ncbi:SMP-30/gluconolactonase/LRE family protein [Serratia sp. M24T3]|uniref:SMP-30/gluconolactonase/LRE family protein n=1 Tax=Serratia sp. M24T3 TaxID=932213 RepID=UPI00025BB69E|nr:SMP-30/gluconolactonase/LRE family protein [Serratia sp. M24T3]EIC82846.1 gluconolactonase (gnl) [Serratia sp. M24T3]